MSIISKITVALVNSSSCDPLDNVIEYVCPVSIHDGSYPVKTIDIATSLWNSNTYYFGLRARYLIVLFEETDGTFREKYKFDGAVLDNLNKFLRNFDAETAIVCCDVLG